MEAALFYILIILLSIDYWFQSNGIGIEKRKVATSPEDFDFHSIFKREGVEVDEKTCREVCEFIEENNIEAAEYLMMMRCKSSLTKIRETVAELRFVMRGGR